MDVSVIPANIVYNELPAIPLGGTPTSTTATFANLIFEEQIRPLLMAKRQPRKMAQKAGYFRQLCRALALATLANGCVRYSRGPYVPRSLLQVVDGAKEIGLAFEHRSPPGSPKESRLVPEQAFRQLVPLDPWQIDPPAEQSYVILRARDDEKSEIPFDLADHRIAAETQYKLEIINAENARHTFTYTPHACYADEVTKQLRPQHVAIFTEDFHKHGRLYTRGLFEHQSLRKKERQTMRMDGQSCVELDYRGMHPRALYHLMGQECPYEDPYALWPNMAREDPRRLLAKLMVSALVNAEDDTAAISACNNKKRLKTDSGELKQCRQREKAEELQSALRETGLTFKEILPLVKEKHASIDCHFGSDAGMMLMRHDSAIALDVLLHFAERGIPCLGLHDSFLVPADHTDELRQVMDELYRERFNGFAPTID